MALNNNLPYRQSIRLSNHDYRQPGAYFITICTNNREPLFGEIIDKRMHLNAAGQMVQSVWNEIPSHFPQVILDEFVVMPDHVHGIVIINDGVEARHAVPGIFTLCHTSVNNSVFTGTACRAPTQTAEFGKPLANSMATIIRSFKSASTKSINELRNTPSMPLWQRNYWERVIRDDDELQVIGRYIQNNPMRWQQK